MKKRYHRSSALAGVGTEKKSANAEKQVEMARNEEKANVSVSHQLRNPNPNLNEKNTFARAFFVDYERQYEMKENECEKRPPTLSVPALLPFPPSSATLTTDDATPVDPLLISQFFTLPINGNPHVCVPSP